jgi:glyoxylase-like metal-dependent hydrolase (beta-lactamase superfamily II)
MRRRVTLKGATVMKLCRWAAVFGLACVLVATARPSAQAPAAGAVHSLKVQGNVYMLVGAGGNVAVQLGDDGVLLVDTGTTANADKLVARLRS